MKRIGRKIYYDVLTGIPLVDTGEFEGETVSETTEEQDIATFKVLSVRNKESFDFVQLAFDKYSQDFIESCGNYRVNPQTKELEFSYPDPTDPEQPPVFQKTLSEQIKDLELKTDEAIMELSMVIAMGGMG